MEPKKKQGFAAMDLEQHREIASKGGKAAQAKGAVHTWTSEEAQRAGRKGGRASGSKPKGLAAVSLEKRREIASKGGQATRATRQHKAESEA